MRFIPISICVALALSGAASAQELANEQPVSYVKSDCEGSEVRPVTEEIIKPARITQITKPVTRVLQVAQVAPVIARPNFQWVRGNPPSDVKAGYMPDPVPIYENKFFPGTYELQDGEVFELQPESYDTIRLPSGQETRRRYGPVRAVKQNWVQTSPGRIKKVITGYMQPPPAIEGGRMLSRSVGYGERTIPAVTKTEMIVTSQTREPAIIQQSYGACMAMPNIDDALE